MKNYKGLKLLSVLLVLSLLIVGCAKDTSSVPENEMKYIDKDQVKEIVETDSDEYILLDVRQSKDYDKEHIKGSYLADQHAANKEGKDEVGIENLKTTLKEATGSETGSPDKKYALVCYSGQSYAQKATDLMIDIGISPDQIYTLEGGMKDWEGGGDEYKNLLTK